MHVGESLDACDMIISKLYAKFYLECVIFTHKVLRLTVFIFVSILPEGYAIFSCQRLPLAKTLDAFSSGY